MDTTPTPAVRSLREWFDAVLEQPAADRARWLEEHVSDAGMRERVAHLVAADAAPGALDEGAAVRAARLDLAPERPADELLGQRFAGFRLERLIGQGGMATVFLGVREGADFEQRAAVKLLRRGLYSELEQQLFRRERRVLASLTHPDIARLIDGGVTPAGIPFLVIEYVDGTPITEHARTHALDERARLALLVAVARAVAAAHRELVVHRDLKPANILVDREGRPRLLDFGVAKLLGDDDDASARTGSAVLTPAYAAPEQLTGGAVSTATDVYSLGVVAHELLLGARPVRGDARTPLRSDLDTVLRKALAEEPAHRYADAAAFADDLERYLESRPVLAHPPSGWYRARKFVRRHRGGVLATALLAAGLVASLALALWQAREAREQARVAQAQAARAQEAQDFVEGLFAPVAQGDAAAQAPTVLELVERGAERIEAEYPDQPEVRADLLALFARLLNALGSSARARPLAEAAVAANLAAYGAKDARSLDAGLVHAQVLRRLGELDAALVELKRWPREQFVGLDAARIVDTISLVRMDQGMDGDEAIALKRESLAARERDPAHTDDDLATGYNNLGAAYQYAGRFAAALEWYGRSLAINRRTRPGSRATAVSLMNVGMTHGYAGELRAAEPLLRESLATLAAVPLEKHPLVVAALNQLCWVQAELEEFAAAQATCDRAVALAVEVLGPTHATTIYAWTRRANAAYAAGRFAEGDADLARASEANANGTGDRGYNDEIIASTRLRRLRWAGEFAALRDAALALLDPKRVVARRGASPAALVQETYAARGCASAPAPACAGHDAARVHALLADPRFARSAQRLSVHNLLAEAALAAGRPADALAELEGMPGGFADELGAGHSQVAWTHWLRAQALGDAASASTEREAARAIAQALPAGHPVREAILAAD